MKNKEIVKYKINEFLEEAKKNNIDNILFRIRKSFKTGIFEIINPINMFIESNKNNIKKLDNKCWYIIPKEKGYIINENDIIKFGKKIYQIIKIRINNKLINNSSLLNKDEMINYISYINNSKGNIFDTFIKLSPERYKIEEYDDNIEDLKIIPEKKYEKDNPKLNFCKCKDKFIFYKEIKNEIKNNIIIEKKENSITYIIKDKFYCDKCNIEYPLRFKFPYSNEINNLIDIDYEKNTDYIILEYLNNMDEFNIKKIHLIKLIDKNEIIIGRDVFDYGDNIKASHTSKNQLSFYLDKLHEKIYLKNKSLSNDTLILIKNNIKLKKEEINFQVEMCQFIANIEEY